MEPTNTHHHVHSTLFKEKMEHFLKECSSSEVKKIVDGQFPLLRKLFGHLSEPKSQIRSFLEMFKVTFKTGGTDSSSSSLSNQNHKPDATAGAGGTPLSEEEQVINKACVEYRLEMHNCFNYKSRSLHQYVGEEELRTGHETGVTTVLNWLRREQQQGRNNINIISEDLIKSTLEKEYSWIKAVNSERFQNHVRYSYKQELRNGRGCLENNFIFQFVVTGGGGGGGEQAAVARCEMQELNRQIDDEIERRVQSFPEKFPLGREEETIAIYVNKMAAALRSTLGELGLQVKSKNGERLAVFVDSYLLQVVNEYGETMSLFLVDKKSLLDVTEIKGKHEQLKTEFEEKWTSKILSLDRAYSTSDQLVRMGTMMEEKFRLLWSRRREGILEENLVGYRKDVMKVIMERMRRMGADVDEPFCARVSALLAPIDGLMKDKVEAVQIDLTQRREDGRVVDEPQTCGDSELSLTATTAPGNDDRQIDDVPPASNETPVAQPSSSMLSSSTSSSVMSPLACKWELEPILNHGHLLPPKTPPGSRRTILKRKSSCRRESINQSLRTFGISLTNGGLRAAITIDHVPHVLTEISTTATAAGHTAKSTIIPLLMGLGPDSPDFVYGNSVARLGEKKKLLWQIDVAKKLFRSGQRHLSSSDPPLTRLVDGVQVTFQLELVLAKILHHVKTLMEKALKERFVGENNNISLEKLLISVPPHFKRLQLRQILDASMVIGLEFKYVATFCEPTILAFDYFRKMLESKPASGNILVVRQYSEYIVPSLFSYKRRNPNLTLCPLKEYPFRDDSGSTPSREEFGEELDFGRISEYLKKHEQECSVSRQPLFVCLSTEEESCSSIIESALKAANVTYAGLFHLDEFASIRGLTSVGDYGFWEGGREKYYVDLLQDRFIKYREEPDVEGSLSLAQFKECKRMFRSFFKRIGNSSDDGDGGGSNDDGHTGSQEPQSKKTRER